LLRWLAVMRSGSIASSRLVGLAVGDLGWHSLRGVRTWPWPDRVLMVMAIRIAPQLGRVQAIAERRSAELESP
jgi:hypothetical protein